jgi:hypothetical protein
MREVERFSRPLARMRMHESFVGNTHATKWFQRDGATSDSARMIMEKL